MVKSDVRTLLPIGSVMRLKDAQKNIMIFGIRQTNQQTGQEYDYIGVLYPEGNMGEEVRFLFDDSDIDKVLFTGYSDDERAQFLEQLQAYFEENRK